MKKYRVTLLLFTFSVILYVFEQWFGWNLIEMLYRLHNSYINSSIIVVPFIFLGLLIDMLYTYRQKKGLQKRELYVAVMHGMNHLMRNLLSHLQVINVSTSLQEEFGEDLISQMNESFDDVESAISKYF